MTEVVVVGGGLAGLTCAKRLVDRGIRVRVCEGLPFLGGRASTYVDNDGDWVEQGLHLFLGVYSEFKSLLREIDAPPEQILTFMPELKLQALDEREAILGTNPLRAPVKTLSRFVADHRALGPIEKLHAALVTAPGLRALKDIERLHDEQSVFDWWHRVSGNKRLMERFLRPFCRGIQFSEPEEFSAANFLGWVHHISRQPHNALLGGYLGPRDTTMFAPLGRYLTSRGARIETNKKLAAIHYDGRITRLAFNDGDDATADAYVLALPFWELLPLLPDAMRTIPFFEDISTLPVAPAISVQLFFEGHVVPTDHFVLVGGTPACVYQDLSRTHFVDQRGSRVSVIVSPADDLLDVDDERITRIVLDDLARAYAGFQGAQIRKSVVLKHRQHLLRPKPGVMSRRPTQATPVPNLFLAGDWTRQEFYASQEGAVRSGNRCADAVISRLFGKLSDATSPSAA